MWLNNTATHTCNSCATGAKTVCRMGACGAAQGMRHVCGLPQAKRGAQGVTAASWEVRPSAQLVKLLPLIAGGAAYVSTTI